MHSLCGSFSLQCGRFLSAVVRQTSLMISSKLSDLNFRECVQKLIRPPVSTHSNFDLNETMSYPAVTFCRNPAFKSEVLEVKIA